MLALTALICSAASAQDVVLDFTNAATDWGIKATSSSKEKGTQTYTNGTYSITIAGDGSNGFAAYKGNATSPGYVLFGKLGASITLPAFDFPVGVVQFIGREGASAAAKMNVFVGDQAICKETAGSVETNNYFIPTEYQNGKQFTIKVTSAHNAQVTKINIFKVGNPDAPQAEEEKPLELVGDGSETKPFTVSDIIAMHAANQDPAEAVWVKGIIAGNIDTANGNKLKVPTSGTDAVASNLAISEGEKFASVQLTNDTDPRSALNIKDHFNYIGTEVAVHGKVTAYCGMAGVKEVDDYKIDAPAAQQLPEGYIPCPVTDFSAVWVNADGKNNVEISFAAPTEMISEMDYTKAELSAPITKIELMRSVSNMGDYQTIATFGYPVAGETLTWTDKNLAYGAYDYMAHVYVDEAMDWANPETVIVGQLPADIEYGEFTATADETDPYKVTLEVTLPSMNSLYEPLTMPITKVVFGEYGPMSFEPDVIYTEENAEVLVPGQKVQYVINKATNGAHTYTAQVYTEAGSNWPATCDIFIGNDQPGMAQNIVAEVTDKGIVVTWEAPTEGLNGGDQGDPANFTYTVKRGADEYDANAVVIAENIKELTVTDNTEFTEETKFVYIVTVTSPYGEGYAASSNEVIVGPAAQLPFEENFDVALDAWGNTTTQHSTWSKDFSGWFCAWQIGQETYINDIMVKPHSGAGLLYAYYNSWGETHQWDSFTSGSIDLTKAETPVITFWLYDVAQGGSDVTLQIQTSTDGIEFTTAQTIALGNATENGWCEVTVPADALKGAERGKVRFLSEAEGSNCIPVVIDDILVKDANATGITGISAASRINAVYNLAGQRVDQNAKGIVIINGKAILKK